MISDNRKPYHQQVADKLIEQIKNGTSPWQKPWSVTSSLAPQNPISKTVYKGINNLYLRTQGYNDPRWLTFKQASSQGYKIKKGEQATPVQYWKWYQEFDKTDENGKKILDKNNHPIKEKIKLKEPKVFYALVFNAEQMYNVPKYEKPPLKWNPVERAEVILDSIDVSIRNDGGDRAFYNPVTDSIHLPIREAFNTASEYYDTALHEVGHSTGYRTRLNRDLSSPKGSKEYAKEELVAEITSLFISDEIGLPHNIDKHASYLESWVSILEEQPFEIIKASASAEKAKNFVLDKEQQYIKSKENDKLIDLENKFDKALDLIYKDDNSGKEKLKGEYQFNFKTDYQKLYNTIDKLEKEPKNYIDNPKKVANILSTLKSQNLKEELKKILNTPKVLNSHLTEKEFNTVKKFDKSKKRTGRGR